MMNWLLRFVWIAAVSGSLGCGLVPRSGGEDAGASGDEAEAEASTEAGTSEMKENRLPEAGPSAIEAAPTQTRSADRAPAAAPPERTAPTPEPAPAPPAPKARVELPEGTLLELELLTALDSSVSRVGDAIQARTLSPLYVKGELVLGEGAYVEGRVTEVEASGRVKGRARLGFTFDQLDVGEGDLVPMRTSFAAEQAEGGEKKDAAVIGGATGVGAIVGGIIGGKKGAAIGAAIGGAGGTGVVLSTKGEEVRLPVGTPVNVRLDAPLSVPAG